METLAVWVDDYALKALPSLEQELARRSALVMRSFGRLPNPATVAQLAQYRQVAVVSGKDLPQLVSRIEMATTTLKVGVIGVLPPGCAAQALLRGPGLLDVLNPKHGGAADRIALMSKVPIVSGRAKVLEPETPSAHPGVGRAAGALPISAGLEPSPGAPAPIGPDSPGLAIASSTGGCWVLADLLRMTRGRRRGPVLVAQHMDAEFTDFFASWLESATGRRTVLVHEGVALHHDVVYVPGGGGDLVVADDGLHVFSAPASGRFVPSANRLLRTFAKAFGDRATAVVLSGMGDDGAAGGTEVLKLGGQLYCQHPSSSIVPSMPESAMKASPRALALAPEALGAALCLPS